MTEAGRSEEVVAVLDWHRAVNDGDEDAVLALVAPDVALGGPRGHEARGRDELRDWLRRARVQLAPRRVFQRGGTVVVEQSAAWWSDETGELSEPVVAGTVFEVADGLLTSVVRYPDVARALEASGLDERDLVIERVH